MHFFKRQPRTSSPATSFVLESVESRLLMVLVHDIVVTKLSDSATPTRAEAPLVVNLKSSTLWDHCFEKPDAM